MFMKSFLGFCLIVAISWSFANPSSVYAKENSLEYQLLGHAGKTYSGAQDPSYIDYDLALREYVVDRINKRFGVALDPKVYSGFDLLEIEAYFECKKPAEPFNIFLNMFPKHP
jgi:hypothetical protein